MGQINKKITINEMSLPTNTLVACTVYFFLQFFISLLKAHFLKAASFTETKTLHEKTFENNFKRTGFTEIFNVKHVKDRLHWELYKVSYLDRCLSCIGSIQFETAFSRIWKVGILDTCSSLGVSCYLARNNFIILLKK